MVRPAISFIRLDLPAPLRDERQPVTGMKGQVGVADSQRSPRLIPAEAMVRSGVGMLSRASGRGAAETARAHHRIIGGVDPCQPVIRRGDEFLGHAVGDQLVRVMVAEAPSSGSLSSSSEWPINAKHIPRARPLVAVERKPPVKIFLGTKISLTRARYSISGAVRLPHLAMWNKRSRSCSRTARAG